MKRVLSIFIVACALLSCENGREPVGPNGESNAIAFGEVGTRAEAVTASTINANGFGVYAFVNTGEKNTPEADIYTSLFEEEERVYWDDNILGLTYDNIKYWEANRIYHFWGIYPYVDGDSQAINTDISGNPTGFSRTFTTPDTADADLLVAYSDVDTSEDTPASVVMNFNHALSKVFFKVHYDTDGNKDDEFVLKEFSISNIKKVGTLTTTLNGNKSWSANQMQNMNFEWSGEHKFGSELNLWENGLMLIPQTIAPSTMNIKVKYVYTDHYVDEHSQEVVASPVEKEVNTYLPAITWKPGVQYTYTMTLHEDDLISFKQIEVATWGSPQQGGAIIIK